MHSKIKFKIYISIIKMPNIIATVQTIITIQTDDETVELVTNSVDSRIKVLL